LHPDALWRLHTGRPRSSSAVLTPARQIRVDDSLEIFGGFRTLAASVWIGAPFDPDEV
jgi:hypothetical protein